MHSPYHIVLINIFLKCLLYCIIFLGKILYIYSQSVGFSYKLCPYIYLIQPIIATVDGLKVLYFG